MTNVSTAALLASLGPGRVFAPNPQGVVTLLVGDVEVTFDIRDRDGFVLVRATIARADELGPATVSAALSQNAAAGPGWVAYDPHERALILCDMLPAEGAGADAFQARLDATADRVLGLRAVFAAAAPSSSTADDFADGFIRV